MVLLVANSWSMVLEFVHGGVEAADHVSQAGDGIVEAADHVGQAG